MKRGSTYINKEEGKKVSKLNYKQKVYLIQLIEVVILILLSLIGLFFSVWEILVSVSIASVFSFIYLFTLVKGMDYVGPSSSPKKAGLFMLFTVIRMVLVFISLLIPALIIKFSASEVDKLRYLYLIGATLPFLVVNLTLSFVKEEMKKESD